MVAELAQNLGSQVNLRMNASSSLLALALLSAVSVTTVCGAETSASAAAPLPPSQRAKVDINTADIPALESIPEIGTNFANAVIAARPFKSVDDLDRVLKIGPEKMNSLREKVTASPMKPPPDRKSENKPTSDESKPSQFNDGKALDRKEVSERYDRTVKPAPAKKSAEKK
jgi:DNA uptake protein ComE-like DNA-binding protein